MAVKVYIYPYNSEILNKKKRLILYYINSKNYIDVMSSRVSQKPGEGKEFNKTLYLGGHNPPSLGKYSELIFRSLNCKIL